jgi:prepilin-type N-terminal cleavage/methylation domain-containing protein
MTRTSGRGAERGFTLLELLVSLSILSVGFAALATLLLQNARVNRAQQMTLAAQSNARNTLSLLLPLLRSAGWDPRNVGIVPVTFDVGHTGQEIRLRADLDEDGDTDADGEDVTVRFQSGRVEWRRTADVTAPFEIVSVDISNDANADGTAEAMFVPDSWTQPTRISVRVTSRSPAPDPTSGQFVLHTAQSDVILRRNV